MTTGPSPFGALLKRHRLAAGLTQEALAERTGVSVRALSDLERGGRTPRLGTMALLAAGLGLTDAQRAALGAAGRPDTGPVPPSGAPTRLPRPLTSFVGREQEVADVRELVLAHPLLTLAGPGGIGKT